MVFEEDIVGRVYAPLTVSCQLTCVSDGSPLTQVKDTEDGTFEPNRKLTPSVILPVTAAQADDGSWDTPNVNYLLANIKWYVSVYENGQNVFKDISTVTAWSGLYEIVTEGTYRGAIRIFRNLEASQSTSLYFEADIPDTRMGNNFHIRTEEEVLSTVEKVGDKYAISLVGADQYEYNPYLDKLLLYDYKVAHGLVTASDELRASCLDGNEYEHEMPFTVYKGAQSVSAGYSVKLYSVASGGTLTELTTGMSEVLSIGTTAVKLDLRLVETKDYVLQVYVESKMVAMKQFSIYRAYPQMAHEVTNRTSIRAADVFYNTGLRISVNGGVAECPECQTEILWNTVATNKATGRTTEHTWNYGSALSVQVADLGLGESINDFVRVRRAVQQKPAFTFACDSGGTAYGDASGNYYIIQ